MSAARLVVRRVGLEQKVFWRNPQSASFTFAMPVVLVAVLGMLYANQRLPGSGRVVVALVPGILAFGLISATYANLAATIAIQRDLGILKRVRATPLPPGIYLAGQIGSALAVSALLTVVVVSVGAAAFAVHLSPGRLPVLALAVAAGCACFSALGLAASAFIRSGESAGAVTSATYIPLSLVSGLFFPFQHQPAWLKSASGLFPVGRLADSVRRPFSHGGIPVHDLVVLAVWAAAGVLVAWRWFRWTEERL